MRRRSYEVRRLGRWPTTSVSLGGEFSPAESTFFEGCSVGTGRRRVRKTLRAKERQQEIEEIGRASPEEDSFPQATPATKVESIRERMEQPSSQGPQNTREAREKDR